MSLDTPPILLSLAPTSVKTSGKPTKTFELSLQNASGKPLTLKGGHPVPEGKQPDGPSSLYLTATGLLTPAQSESMFVEASGWNAQCYKEGAVTWAACPEDDLTLAPNETVVLTLKAVVKGPPRPAQLTVDFYLPEEVSGTRTLPVIVEGVSGPPAPVECGLLDSRVFTTVDSGKQVANTLYLRLTNTSQEPLAQSWPAATPPRFVLSFLCSPAPGYGALATTTQAQAISVDVAPQHRARWGEAEKHTEGPIPYWVVEPSASNQQILGTGSEASLELVISNLITELPVEAPDPTLAYVQLVSFPGCGDSWLMVPIVKLPGPPPGT